MSLDASAEKGGMGKLNDDLWVISFIGRDRPGLISDILEEPARQNVNIVDMDQKVMQGIFAMTVVADFSGARLTAAEMESWLRAKAGSLGVQFGFLPAGQLRGRRRSSKSLYVVTILAKDRVGIIRDMSGLAASNRINIERASVTARGDLISIEFLMDFADCEEDDNNNNDNFNVNSDDCKARLKKECEHLG
ncbi:MAG TPA: ACT domain-containing protein, partial [Methanothrix sp.]|nr:ACT domain-containing protein [Methanothrix sp.]